MDIKLVATSVLLPVLLLVLLFIERRRLEHFAASLRDIFRGGPRPPTHPIPGDDSRFLTRRRVKAD